MSNLISHPSITLLQICADSLDDLTPILNRKSKDFDALRCCLESDRDFPLDSDFWNNPLFTQYLQVLLLLGLSMHGGILIPMVQTIKTHNRHIRIKWGAGVEDQFTMGKADKHFFLFVKFFMQKVLGKTLQKKGIPSTIFFDLFSCLVGYQAVLEVLVRRLSTLNKHEKNLLSLFDNNLNSDLLFLLISCLPTEQLNQFFIHIHQFFPDDLNFKMSSGNRINVVSHLGSPSTDPYFLVDKVRTYYELYHSKELPIIQEITQSRSYAYFSELFKDKKTYNSTLDTLNLMRDNQIFTRERMYMIFIDHLQWIIPKASLVES